MRFSLRRQGRRLVAGFSAAALLAGCWPAAAPPLRSAASVTVTPIKSIGAWQGRLLLFAAGVKDLPVRLRVDCYRVTYPSRASDGRSISLSGLLALPRGVAPHGLVSFQHGTTTTREAVPSNLSLDGLAAAIVFAGNGYAIIAPDYVGQGISDVPHPYYIADAAARAVTGMLSAVRGVSGVPRAAPFLIGFSEGGYASLAALRDLEADREPVLGVAAISGAYHLRDVSLPATLKGGAAQDSLYLALWVRGHTVYYHHPLESVFAPAYARLVPELLDHPHAPKQIVRALPARPQDLFVPSVLWDIKNNRPDWLLDALVRNDVATWAPITPVRLYYGLNDVDVTPDEALSAEKTLRHPGARIQAISLGPVDHNGAVLAAAPGILAWLQSLTVNRPASATSAGTP